MVLNTVKKTIKRENLIQKSDVVLVALSGGADSLCLLDVMMKLKDEYDLKIYAAHLNHRIRGLDAQKDAIYCSEICKKQGINFFLKSVDVIDMAKKEKKSIEEVARNVRYDMFFDLKEKLKIDKIAVAHNLDDQAETVLMKLIRGSGLKGLRGIDYSRDDGIIRPLLDVYKKDIIQYCEKENIVPRIDQTNLEDEYTRNKIRLNLIPYLEENYCENIKEILSRTANSIRDDYRYMHKISTEKYDLIKKTTSEDNVELSIDLLNNIDISIKKRIIMLAIQEVLKDLKNIENIHIMDIIELIDKSDGKMLNLPRNLKVYLKDGKLIFTTKDISLGEEIMYSYKLNINGYTRIDELSLTVNTRVLSKQDSLMLPTSKFIKVFDFEKLNGDLILRSRDIGDKIKAIGLNGTKKIKDVLIDMKIPKEERFLYPILSDDKDVLWLFGYRISENYKIDSNTNQVIRIQLEYDVDRRKLVEKFV